MQTNWNELLWAALTVGRPNTAYVLAHGDAYYYEALFRLSLVRMAVEYSPLSPQLQRTDAFRSLDPTEKGAVSYFLGMAVCKLFASRLLDTPWLLHLDVFRDQLNPGLLGGRSRPDLVGMDKTGAWHAFECKGRSSVPNTEDKRKAKQQAERLVRVDSTDCSLQIGSISYFRQDKLEFHWRDPKPDEDEALEPIQVEVPEGAWRHYYQPALALANAGETVGLAERGAGAQFHIEIHEAIRELLLAEQWNTARLLASELEPILTEGGFGPDGLKVLAGDWWARERGTEFFDV